MQAARHGIRPVAGAARATPSTVPGKSRASAITQICQDPPAAASYCSTTLAGMRPRPLTAMPCWPAQARRSPLRRRVDEVRGRRCPRPARRACSAKGGQLLAERAGVLLVQVDLVLRAAADQCSVDLPGRDGRSPGEVPCRQPDWSVVKCVCSRSRPAARLPAAAARHIAVPGGESSSVSVCAPQAACMRAAAWRSADRASASHVSGRHSHVSGRHRPTPVIGFGL